MKQKCYFHKNRFINNFCVIKQCTLPLCPQCLPIHEEQHKVRNQTGQILNYDQAYQSAYETLTSYVQRNKKIKDQIFDRLSKDKQECLKLIVRHFQDEKERMSKSFKQFDEIELKYQKLVNGSIKMLIYYYSGDIQLKENSYELKEIYNDVRKVVENFEKKKEEIQTFRQMNNLNTDQFQQIKCDDDVRGRKRQIFKSNTVVHLNRNHHQEKGYAGDLGNNVHSIKQTSNNHSFRVEQKRQTIDKQYCYDNKNIQYNMKGQQSLKDGEFQPKKWKKNYEEKEDSFSYGGGGRERSEFSNVELIQLKQNRTILNRVDQSFNNRRPLKTTDLQTFIPINIDCSKFQVKDRSVSHDLGSRTMSHNNLPSTRKFQPINENLKKQVLSPQQIRKMLQKRIEERNRALTEKKQLNLNLKITTTKKNELQRKESQEMFKCRDENHEKNKNSIENVHDRSGYNTRQSIINQIYRQTRY